MAPDLPVDKQPDARAYATSLAMAQAVRDALRRADLEPRDLVDVADLIRETMRPSTKRL